MFVTWKGPVRLTAIDPRGRSPLLAIVRFCGGDVWLMIVSGKLREVEDKESVGGAAPVPFSCTVWVPASSTMVSHPVAGPAEAGANATCNWQSLAPASEVVPHELVANTNGPETVTLAMAAALWPLFSAVTESGFDVVPTFTWPKSMLVGDRFTTPGVSPVPLNATERDPLATLAATDN